MKVILVSMLAVLATGLCAQPPDVRADVYHSEGEASGEGKVLKGPTTDLAALEVVTVKLPSGKSYITKHSTPDMETLVLVKGGILNVTILDQDHDLGQGSIALILPQDKYTLRNNNKNETTFFVMTYRSKKPMDIERGREAGGSFVVNRDDLTFKPHDKGGIRNYFERPTSMTERFEMHVTTLNKGLKSHEPHTHKAEEIVLMIKGDAEMQIDDAFKKAGTGDLIFLSSGVPHAIRNAGEEACEYFAFQW